jgi:HK97 gp10 family phage protein
MRQVLKILPAPVRKQIKTAVLSSAEEMADTMKALAKVKTGELRQSIEVTSGDENVALYNRVKSSRIEKDPELAAIIHSDSPHARDVEFGTAPHVNAGEFRGTQNPGAHAQPFFFPAYRARKRQAQAKINRAARQGIKDGLK